MIGKNLSRSRIAISFFYFIAGLIFASWASRIPDIKTSLSLSDGDLGKILFAIPTVQLSMMLISGYAVTKFGSRKILPLSILLYAIALLLIAIPNGSGTIFLVLFFFGTAANIVNIALNTQACGLEALYQRNIMASFHGLWSLGGFLGGIVGAVLAQAGYSILTHFAFIAVVSVMMALIAGKNLISDSSTAKSNDGESRKRLIRFDLPLILLGLIGFAGMFCEGTMFDWSSVYFATVIKPEGAFIRLGYIASMGTMTLGRFIADRFVYRYQAPKVLTFCGLLITSGLLLATAFPNLIVATLGFMLIGLGVSSIVPICYSESGRLQNIPASVAITIVSSISFVGFMIGPPLMGLLSEATNLRVALGIASSFGILIVFFTRKFQTIKNRNI